MWICKDCGQHSSQDSTECEICGEPRSKTETAVQPKRSGNKFFEIDGQKYDMAMSCELTPCDANDPILDAFQAWLDKRDTS